MVLIWRYIKRHRSRPEPGFEVDGSHPGEVEPFPVPSSGHNEADAAQAPLEPGNESSTPPGASESQSLAPVASAPLPGKPAVDSRAPLLASAAGDNSDDEPGPRPQRRAVHEEDAEDAELDVLPPVYREAWAARRSQTQLQDASAVTRAEKGNRAQDGAAQARPDEKLQ